MINHLNLRAPLFAVSCKSYVLEPIDWFCDEISHVEELVLANDFVLSRGYLP